MGTHHLDAMARVIFRAALDEDRAGELLAHLFDSGGVTIEFGTGRLVLIPPEMIEEAAETSG
jgi:hypothetical protein